MLTLWLPVLCALIRNANTQYEEPFEEACPPDSFKIEGVCKCDHSLCDIPPCQTTLVPLANLTDVPGSCCPTYTCEDCAEGDRIEGMCPCLPGAILRSGRRCECASSHHTLINGTCECDPNKCQLPELCNDGSVAVREQDECCEKVTCIECPPDSYPTSYNNAALEDVCVCYPCLPVQCNGSQLHIYIRAGEGVAGKCCDVYSCEGGCSVNGTMYSDGERWETSESQCNCQNGVSVCSSKQPPSGVSKTCLGHDQIYHHNETWIEDSCTNCTCIHGERKCIAHMCDVQISEVKCPSMATCKKLCDNGFRLNKHGCEICKCKTENRTDRFERLLQEYNITEETLTNLIRHRADSSTTSSIVTPSTTICITEHKKTRGDCAYSCILEYGAPGFAVGAIFAAILLFTFLRCSEKNRQKYKMHYDYRPVGGGKETLDKNLNISPIISSKNFELQSYNEKRNVI